jgi:hypothetical protein
MPAQLTYMVAFARLDRGLEVVRTSARLTGAGVVPFLGADPAAVGLAPDRAAGVYSTGILPTLLLPVASPARLGAWLDGQRPADTAASDHRGARLAVWSSGSDWLAWTVVGDYLAVHRGSSLVEPPGADWLDELLDARPFAGSDDLKWAAAHAGPSPEVLALAHVPRIVGAWSLFEPQRAGCGPAHGWAAQTFGRTVVFGRMAAARVELGAVVELEEGPVEELAQRTAAPDPALQAVREEAPLFLAQGTDPEWLAAFGPANLGKLCQGARTVRDLVRAGGFLHAPMPWLTGGALALFEARAAGDEVAAVGIAAARTRDVAAIPRAPHIHLPPFADPLALEPGPGDVRVSLGPEMHDRFAASARGNPAEILGFAVDLDRLGDLDAAARVVALLVPDAPRLVRAAAAALRRIAFESIARPDGVGLALDLELRDPGTPP